MRKAFTLAELVVMLAILPILMVGLYGFFAAVIGDVPRATKTLQEHTTLLNLLEMLNNDLDSAVSVSAIADRQSNGVRLCVELTRTRACYIVGDGRVERRLQPSELNVGDGDAKVWRLPNSVVSWRLWSEDERAYAVEVNSHIEQRHAGERRKHMAKSYVYYIGACGGGTQL